MVIHCTFPELVPLQFWNGKLTNTYTFADEINCPMAKPSWPILRPIKVCPKNSLLILSQNKTEDKGSSKKFLRCYLIKLGK